MKENPDRIVEWGINRGQMNLTVEKRRGTWWDAIYSVKGDPDKIQKDFHALFAVMELVGVEDIKGTGYRRCYLDRESILAVVPGWEKVI